jgi:hypothetical protein
MSFLKKLSVYYIIHVLKSITLILLTL